MPFAPTPPEQQLVTALFNVGDPQKVGIISGESAVKLLSGAKVSPQVLGEIWAIADSDNNGFLTKKGVAVLIRLLGWAQKGETVNEDLLNKVGPLPTIDGLPLPKPATPTPSTPTIPAARAVPPLSSEDRNKFVRLFLGCGPQNGVISGDKAKDVFLKSNLPMEKLGLIWNLADTQNRGSLDQTDFIIGMFFIQLAMSQPSFVIPGTLPPGLYEQASGGKSPQSIRTHQTGSSSTGPGSPVARQFTGQPVRPQYTGQILAPQHTGQPLSTQHTGQGLHSPQLTGASSRLSMAPSGFPTMSTSTVGAQASAEWDISAQEKATADSFFATLDTQRHGYVEGDVAVPFMVKSGLPEAVLAQIWDLADLHNDGRLTQEGFAIALHLINGKLTGKEVPDSLPSSLVPPSMRTPAPQHSSIHQDMISLLGETPPPSASAASATFPPPVPAPRATSPPQVSLRQPAFTLGRNLLEDDEDDSPTTPAGPDHSIQIGNVQNQLNSTNRSLENTKAERQKAEADVTNSAATLAQLETQLAASKAAYETESRLFADLREKLLAQTASITKTRQELITSESDLSAIRQEKNEIQGKMLRDKDEVLDLQRKMKQVADETEVIKKEIEKVKKDARHQKGLLAIGKKQLATAEGEREKAEKELIVAQKELELATKEVEEAKKADVDVLAVATALPQSPPVEDRTPLSFADAFPDTHTEAVASPQSTRSMNPFAAMTGGSGTPRSGTPFSPFATSGAPAPQRQESVSLDDPFGFATAFAAQPVATPPPVASQIASPAPIASPPRVASPELKPTSSPAPAITAARIATPPPASVAAPAPIPVSAPAPTATVPPTSSAPVPADAISLDTPTTDADEAEEARRFPPLGEIAKPSNEQPENELPPLEDLPQQDEDSSSDDDSDSENYAEAKANPAANGQPATEATPKATATEPQRAASPTPRAATPKHEATSSATTSAFDDVFGTSTTPSMIERPSPADSPTPSGTANAGQSAVAPVTTQPAVSTPFSTIAPAEPPKTATVSDFDEAFSSLAAKPNGGAAPTTAAFSFDDAFGDTFDFGDPSIPAIPVTTVPTTTTAPSAGLSLFDEAFKPAASSATQPAGKTSFDDAFGIEPTTDAPAPSSSSFDNAFGFTKPAGSEATATNGAPATSAAPKPADAPTSSPVVAPTPRAAVPSSPVPSTQSKAGRAASPAPSGPSASITSPKRAESPSSLFKRNGNRKNSNAFAPPAGPPPSSPPAEEPAPVKHSKFHFPGFGRSKTVKKEKEKEKDKHKAEKQAPPPPPARQEGGSTISSYSSSVLNSTAAAGPGEDVEGVRAITAMGFSREQAVDALEKHGYDVNRALNELLGDNTA
ncbi:hypothetical protein FRB90_011486 [Tulasnella sp. 427]|nr:hypothetical protein FRB90_011486 [Tulasnella sp. 427]